VLQVYTVLIRERELTPAIFSVSHPLNLSSGNDQQLALTSPTHPD
jgi:hypothetical protein